MLKIIMKDGTVKEFQDTRPGGSYRAVIRYEIGFVVITDVWLTSTSIPSDQIQSIEHTSPVGGRF